MNLPKRCGKMFVKFDDKGELEYGFEVKGNEIVKFVPLKDGEIHTIILPPLVDNEEFPLSSVDMKSPHKATLYFQKRMMEDYVKGRVKLCAGCFKGMKKLRIVVPFENSVMLDWGCFESDAKIELVLPQNLTLKQIGRFFDAGYDYERENWTLIADKKIRGQFGDNGLMRDDYSICEYDPENLSHTVANLSISPLLKTASDREIAKAKNVIEKERGKG